MTNNTRDDGGPAYATAAGDGLGGIQHQEGMSLRDWFAGQADAPDQADLTAAAGMVFSAGKIWHPSNSETAAYPNFVQWWEHLSWDERAQARATCRFRYADAMLAQRKKDAEG